MYNRPAFIQITKKSIIAKLTELSIKPKYHKAIAEDIKRELTSKPLLAYCIDIAIRKLNLMKEEVYKDVKKNT